NVTCVPNGGLAPGLTIVAPVPTCDARGHAAGPLARRRSSDARQYGSAVESNLVPGAKTRTISLIARGLPAGSPGSLHETCMLRPAEDAGTAREYVNSKDAANWSLAGTPPATANHAAPITPPTMSLRTCERRYLARRSPTSAPLLSARGKHARAQRRRQRARRRWRRRRVLRRLLRLRVLRRRAALRRRR